MKMIIVLTAVSTIICAAAFAKTTRVRGYIKKNGTYVAPHQQTAPNETKADNWSKKGNENPYTGKKGTKK